ncbi:MAG: tetratricopeptide repeat protein [Vicinamibacteria bacterium]
MSSKKRPVGRTTSLPRAGLVLAALAVVAAAAAGLFFRREGASIPDPDTSGMEPQVAERIREVRAEVSGNPREAELWGKLGRVLQAHELYREAAESYAEASRRNGFDFRWAYLRARSLKEIQELELALEAIGTAKAAVTSYAPLHILEAELHEQLGRTEPTIASYRKALEIDGRCAAAELGLGRLELERGNLEESLWHLERASELQPDSGGIQAALARARQRAGKRGEARAAAELARALHPEVVLEDPVMAGVSEEAVSLVGYQKRAAEAEAKGQRERAEALLRKTIEIRPEEADLHYNLGNFLARHEKGREAERAYRRTIEVDPEHVPALINLGIVLSGRRELPEAEALFRKALDVSPRHPGALASLAKIAALQGDAAAAIRNFERALAEDPAQSETHYALAQVLRREGRLPEALRSFQRALELAPDRADIHIETAVICASLGDYGSAWRHVQRARQIGLEPPGDFLAALSSRMPEPH